MWVNFESTTNPASNEWSGYFYMYYSQLKFWNYSKSETDRLTKLSSVITEFKTNAHQISDEV